MAEILSRPQWVKYVSVAYEVRFYITGNEYTGGLVNLTVACILIMLHWAGTGPPN